MAQTFFLLRTAFARLVLAVDFKVDNNNKKGGNEWKRAVWLEKKKYLL